MINLKIYHNPRCAKSRETLDLIHKSGVVAEVVEYLKTPPTFAELKDLLVRLHLKAEQIVRKSEALYKSDFKGKNFNEDEWITILVENPILIERPIVVRGNKAILGRPPGNVLTLL
jgi:arsenate reductase